MSIKINHAVPQRNILGPFLFLIYIYDIEDLLQSQSEVTLTNYADDTSFLISRKCLNTVKNDAASLAQRANRWFAKNKLAVNTKETNALIFGTSRAKVNV